MHLPVLSSLPPLRKPLILLWHGVSDHNPATAKQPPIKQNFARTHDPFGRCRENEFFPDTSRNIPHALVAGTLRPLLEAEVTNDASRLAVSPRLTHESSCSQGPCGVTCLHKERARANPQPIADMTARREEGKCLGILTASFAPPPRSERFRVSGCSLLLHPCNESLR